jgi:AhpD family alkylhydroperoxidase
MKNILIIIFSLSALFSTATDKEYEKLVKENSNNSVYPKVIIKDAVKDDKAMKALYKESDIPEKYAELIALAVSAALKCQYCIPAHKQFALDAGATEEEIKIAVNIAAHVASGSTLFYGNEFDLELFKEGLEK